MPNRAERRRALARMKAKARRVYHWVSPEQAIKLANHLAQCSCAMCGNPRRYRKGKARIPIGELRRRTPD